MTYSIELQITKENVLTTILVVYVLYKLYCFALVKSLVLKNFYDSFKHSLNSWNRTVGVIGEYVSQRMIYDRIQDRERMTFYDDFKYFLESFGATSKTLGKMESLTREQTDLQRINLNFQIQESTARREKENYEQQEKLLEKREIDQKREELRRCLIEKRRQEQLKKSLSSDSQFSQGNPIKTHNGSVSPVCFYHQSQQQTQQAQQTQKTPQAQQAQQESQYVVLSWSPEDESKRTTKPPSNEQLTSDVMDFMQFFPREVISQKMKDFREKKTCGADTDTDAKQKETEKKPIHSFMKFCAQKRPEICKQHPEWDKQHIAKKLGEMWRLLSEEEKNSFRCNFNTQSQPQTQTAVGQTKI